MIAIIRPRRRVGRAVGVAAAIAVVLVIELVPRPARMKETPRPDEWRLVSLAGHPLDEPTCAAFIDELVVHPRWQLHVADHESTCTARWDDRRFVIDEDGTVVWSAPGMPDRRLTLTADELARVRTLGGLDCTQQDDAGNRDRSYELAWGDETDGAVSASGSSALAAALDAIVDAAIDRYDAARIAAVPAMCLELDARPDHDDGAWPRHPRFHATLAPDGRLTIRRDGRVVHEGSLDLRSRVDLLDTILASPAPAADDDDVVRGRAAMGADVRPIRFDDYGYARAFEPLARAIDDATDQYGR